MYWFSEIPVGYNLSPVFLAYVCYIQKMKYAEFNISTFCLICIIVYQIIINKLI